MMVKSIHTIGAVAIMMVGLHETAMSQVRYEDAAGDTAKRVVINNYYYGPSPYYAEPMYGPYVAPPYFHASFFTGFHRPTFVRRFPVFHRFHPRVFGVRRIGGRRY